MLPGSSPITEPQLLRKRARSQGPFLRRHYPASQVVRPCPTPARPAVLATASEARPPAGTGLPRLPGSPFQRAVPITPVDRNGCICRLLPHSTRPSPTDRRVGIHKFTFEACSGFTRVTARWIAQPPEVTFVTRLQHGQLPDRPARQLPDQPTILRVASSSTGDPRLRGARSVVGYKHAWEATSGHGRFRAQSRNSSPNVGYLTSFVCSSRSSRLGNYGVLWSADDPNRPFLVVSA